MYATQDLRPYLKDITVFPLLTADQEQNLGTAIANRDRQTQVH